MIGSTLTTTSSPAAVRQHEGARDALGAHSLLFLSGAAALTWQVLWTARLGTALGHEYIGVLAVLAAFFGGLALGAWTLGDALAASRWPGRWYAVCEAVLLAWAGLIWLTLPRLVPALAGWIGPEPSPLRHWSFAFGVPLLLLLPACAAMGATLPALERQLQGDRSRLGSLYASNTAGAVAGLLGSVFVGMPLLGLAGTAWLCAGTNAVCAMLAWWLWGAAKAPVQRPAESPATARWLRPAALFAATGFVGIGYEVVAVRVLSQVTENTVYSYALIVAVYLLGTAAGAAAYQRWAPRATAGDAVRDQLLAALAISVLLGTLALRAADVLAAWPGQFFGPGVASALAGEALAALAAMAAPTIVMGALFTHLGLQAQAAGAPLGKALALNTAGAALAPWLIGIVLLPWLGPAGCLALAGLAYVAMRQKPTLRRPAGWLVAAATLALWLGSGPLRFVDLPEGGHVVSYRDGVLGAVSVVEDGAGIARLRIDNRAQEGSSAGGLVERRLALLPLLLHPEPRRALFLGLGTGLTAAAAAEAGGLQVDVVELLPEVVEAAKLFAGAPSAPRPARPLHVATADARRFVLAGNERYDVVVADLFHPARSGAGTLYTVEQFAAVRRRLAPGGVYCQWLAVHQMDLETLRSIVAAFVQVYPEAVAVLAGNSLDSPVLGLIARPDAAGLDLASLRQQVRRWQPATGLVAARLDDEYAVAGSVVAGPAALASFVGGALANSDDRPLVVHRAPWATYAPQTTPRQRLLTLLAELTPKPADVLLRPDEADAARLLAYWQARRGYLELGAIVRPSADPAVMLARLETPLLALLRKSPDFRPAAEALRAMARAQPASESGHADALLRQLDALRPSDTVTSVAP